MMIMKMMMTMMLRELGIGGADGEAIEEGEEDGVEDLTLVVGGIGGTKTRMMVRTMMMDDAVRAVVEAGSLAKTAVAAQGTMAGEVGGAIATRSESGAQAARADGRRAMDIAT